MEKLEKAISLLHEINSSGKNNTIFGSFSPIALLIISLCYIGVMISVPLGKLSMLICFGVYPIIACALVGLEFSTVFKRSLWVLPFVIFVGIFNPLLDTTPAFSYNGIVVTKGWISFISIVLRGLFSVQALLILIFSTGFNSLCHSLEVLHLPSILSTQLMFIYRYLTVLLEESLDMSRARKARGYGRKTFSLKMWSVFIGQLFIRTVDRAENINRAMLARGFNGKMPSIGYHHSWKLADWLIVILSISIFLLMRLIDISSLLNI